jgi:transcriptional regulator with PAS, ATPase and Fis domain
MENEVEALGRARPDLDAPVDFFQEVEQFEIELIRGALKRAHGNQKHASKLLGLNHTTKIRRYGSHQAILKTRLRQSACRPW